MVFFLTLKKFLLGLVLGLLFGCILGFALGEVGKSSSINNSGTEFIEASTLIVTPTVFLTLPFTLEPTMIYTSTITETPAPTSTATMIATPLSPILNIPYTACGDHMAYSASAEIIKIPIIENDKIIEYATYVLVTYRIKNTYDNTPIYGFEIRPSPGYTNPALYPHKSQMFDGDPLIQPNEEVILKSEHLFVPDSWSFDEHTNAYWKFPENLRFHPYPYESAIGGYTVTFQIFELFNFSKPDELRCDGAIRTK